MFCEHCGQPNEEGSRFCEFCGKKIGTYEKEPRSSRNLENHTSENFYRPSYEQNSHYEAKKSTSQAKKSGRALALYGLIGLLILGALFVAIYFGFIKDKGEPIASDRKDKMEARLEEKPVENTPKVVNEEKWLGVAEEGISYIEKGNDYDGVKLLETVP